MSRQSRGSTTGTPNAVQTTGSTSTGSQSVSSDTAGAGFKVKGTGDSDPRAALTIAGLILSNGSGTDQCAIAHSGTTMILAADGGAWFANAALNADVAITHAVSGISQGVVAGSPEGVTTAPVGSTRIDSATGTEYRKTMGAGNTGWCAVAGPTPINTQTDSYAAVLEDQGKAILMNKGTANTLTLPANADVAWPVGTKLTVVQIGAGQTTIAVTSDTITGTPGLKLRAQWSSATLLKTGETTWVALGDLAA